MLRQWQVTENWCSLCKEPFNSYSEHRGKRDHICLEMFYDSLVDYHRVWAADSVVLSMQRSLRNLTMHALFSKHDSIDVLRREDAFAMLSELKKAKIILLGRELLASPLKNKETSYQGSLAMFEWHWDCVSRLFPKADAKQVSSFTQMAASAYNLETVYDLCGLKHLFQPGDFAEGTDDYTYFYKGVWLRSILGQLRWMMDPRAEVLVPNCPAQFEVIGAIVFRLLIAETIFTRACEYVCRVEAVWREHLESYPPSSLSPVPKAPSYGFQMMANLPYPPKSSFEATSRAMFL